MLQAAQLAMDAQGGPQLDVKDTAGTPDGAATAARAAVADGVGLILGPLTSAETAAVAPIARQANVAVLAFTNDPSQAATGGLDPWHTPPGQQVRRLIAATMGQGKSAVRRSAARHRLLRPRNGSGTDAGNSSEQRNAEPNIRFYAVPGMSAINAAATRDVSGCQPAWPDRGADACRPRVGHRKLTAAGPGILQKAQVGPPPFNVLLLADTGVALEEIASMLAALRRVSRTGTDYRPVTVGVAVERIRPIQRRLVCRAGSSRARGLRRGLFSEIRWAALRPWPIWPTMQGASIARGRDRPRQFLGRLADARSRLSGRRRLVRIAGRTARSGARWPSSSIEQRRSADAGTGTTVGQCAGA